MMPRAEILRIYAFYIFPAPYRSRIPIRIGLRDAPSWGYRSLRLDPSQGAGFPDRLIFFESLKESEMLDAILVVAGIAFFAVAVLYVVACDRM